MRSTIENDNTNEHALIIDIEHLMRFGRFTIKANTKFI